MSTSTTETSSESLDHVERVKDSSTSLGGEYILGKSRSMFHQSIRQFKNTILIRLSKDTILVILEMEFIQLSQPNQCLVYTYSL